MKTRSFKILIQLTAIVISIVLMAYSINNIYTNAITKQQNEHTKAFLSDAKSLELNIKRTLTYIYGLNAYVFSNRDAELTQQNFEDYAQKSIRDSEYIRNFSIAPNNVQEFVYPLQGNEITLGHNLEEDHRENVVKDVLDAMQTKKILISGPYILRQGNLGMVIRSPIYSGDDYWGLVNVVIDLESILNEANRSPYLNTITKDNSAFVTYDVKEGKDIHYEMKIEEDIWMLNGYLPDELALDAFINFVRISMLIMVLIVAFTFFSIHISTKNLLLSDKIKGLIYRDVLTNLPNRRALNLILDDLLSKDKAFVLAFIDLDNFKTINDALGHTIGDKILTVIGERFNLMFPNVTFRWGGDEFIIIHKAESKDSTNLFINDILTTVHDIIVINGIPYNIKCSIGVSFYPDDARNAEDIIKHADAAMYDAKINSQTQVVYYNDKIGEHLEEEHRIISKLTLALDHDLLKVYYQKQYSVNPEKAIYFEALIRWHDDLEGWISPGVFIPIAEKNNLIKRIDEYVITKVIHQLRAWMQINKNVHVAINISSMNFNDDIYNYIKKNLLEFNVPSDHLILEITETAMLQNSISIHNMINNLNNMSIKVALDDFGTGFSSLNHLSNLPIDILKIDMSFIRSIKKTKEKVIVKSLMDITKALNIATVAEGIETEEEFKIFTNLGCDYLQGYYIAKPLPAEEIDLNVKSIL